MERTLDVQRKMGKMGERRQRFVEEKKRRKGEREQMKMKMMKK